jgi:hypothetical protein
MKNSRNFGGYVNWRSKFCSFLTAISNVISSRRSLRVCSVIGAMIGWVSVNSSGAVGSFRWLQRACTGGRAWRVKATAQGVRGEDPVAAERRGCLEALLES